MGVEGELVRFEGSAGSSEEVKVAPDVERIFHEVTCI